MDLTHDVPHGEDRLLDSTSSLRHKTERTMRIGCVDKQAHLELDVAVGHTRGVQVLHAAHNLLKEVSCIILWKAPRFANQAKQLPTCMRTIIWTLPVTST
jgi:hypothetical protein